MTFVAFRGIMTNSERIKKTLEKAEGSIFAGEHHKTYVIDQMVRALTGCPMVKKQATDCESNSYTFETMGESQEYLEWVAAYQVGEDGPMTYVWDTGIAP